MIKTDLNIPVALIFFARPDVLKETFNAIKKSRPSKLFLIQDGARENRKDDLENIELCLEIVNDIDWDCEVYKNYSDENLGCGMRIYTGLNWAFEHVDRLLIIEDDCVPAPSLFPFCADLLEKYKNDDRIGMISGMNNLGVYENSPADYFFSISGSIWGWATWKRVWDKVEYDLDFLKDKYATNIVFKTDAKMEPIGLGLSNNLKNGKKLSSWSFQSGMNMRLQHQLNIVPKYNMISNIGLSENGANSVSSIKYVAKGLRSIYFMKTYGLKFPLKHPKYIVNDLEFKKKLDRLMGDGYPLVQFYRVLETVFYRVIGGDFKSIIKGFKRRFL